MTTAIALLGVFGVLWAVRTFAVRGAGDAGPFTPVDDADALQTLFASSLEAPVVLFLHDPYCPVSGGAYRKMTRALAEVHLIDVSRQQALSRAVEAETGVRHESPQVIVLRDGAPVYDAAHGRIDPAAVDRATGAID